MSLMKRFYRDRYLHIRSFSLNLAAGIAACAALYAFHAPEFYHYSFAWWHIGLIPLGIYIGGLSAVYIHNATHSSFRNPVINEICGYIAGIHQLWGYMGWKLIHLLHHMYSDNVDMDVHPPKGMSFWQFARVMFLYSSATVSKRYREQWGVNAKTKLLHKMVLITFTAMALTNLAFWFLLLGPAGFIFFYIPSYITNHLLFVDINYTAHPVDPDTGETAPANLDHNWYFKLANFMWHGIYYHANHHRKPALFNPKYMPVSPRKSREVELDQAEAA